MRIRAMHCEPGQHRPPAPDVPMDLLRSGFYIYGPKPEIYLEKQRKSAASGETVIPWNAVFGDGICSCWKFFPWKLSCKAQLPHPHSCQAHAMSRAWHHVQQATTTHGLTVHGHKMKPPVPGTGASAGSFLQEPVQKPVQMEKAESSWVG